MLKKASDRELLEQQDEELIMLIQKGSITAVEKLYDIYKGLIYNAALNFMNENGLAQMYLDDLVDVATDTLLRCSQKYIVDEKNSFLNYWWGVTHNQFNSFLRKTVNSGIVYFDPFLVETSEVCLCDSTRPALSRNADFSFREIIRHNKEIFTVNESIFVKYFLDGLKPLEIAQMMSWNKAKLYRIKKSAMNKLNKIIKSN